MTIMAIVLAVTSTLCSLPIDSARDLGCSIRYVDKQQGYFIGIEKNNVIIGTARDAVKNPANDVSQVDGRVENCSSRAFKCRSIAELVFAIPKSADHSAEYTKGPRISVQRLANGGWHGSAMCSMIAETGCAPHVDVNKLVEAYQYDVSPAGVVTSVKIQNWNDAGKLLSTYNLVLVSESGLELN
ncbi:hypothetical protein [Dyella silvatica]|uniref:hypothetical protein n=1 Tax=Dyella silvatica TaxID=2992128 RepID=UPI0022517FCC|nr:hypothetical protein [Dyella silvatica]